MRERYSVFREVSTRWMDNDVYGHVNNVVYYSYFDTVINAHLIAAGALEPREGGVIGLCVESGCRYHAPLSFPEVIEAGLVVARLGTSSVRYEVGLFRRGDEAPAAEGYFVHVFVDRATRRPTPIAGSLRAALSALVAASEAP